jgi:uncharacterized protein (DUF2141 family)
MKTIPGTKTFVFFIFAVTLLMACASQAVLTGGEKDTTPPQLVVEKSSPNLQTNFTPQDINLFFDEFVKVQDVFNQVIVSPPLEYNPKVETKGKKIVFSFHEKEVLRPNTTYIIQFGNAVQDITESNPAEALKFVFSTGSVIDSLVLSGTIKDFAERKPVDGAIAILYDQDQDSMVYTSRPLYFAKADKQGRFTITHISPGTYQLVGLKDENNNYKFDNPKELVGFTDSLLNLNSDTLSGIEILLFSEVKAPLVQDVDSTTKGLLKIRFDREPDAFSILKELPELDYYWKMDGTTMHFWHRSSEINRWYLFYETESGKKDSVRLVSYPLNPEMVQGAITINCGEITGQTQHPDSLVLVRFSRPLQSINSDLWMIRDAKDSTVAELPVQIEEKQMPEELFRFKPPAAGSYELMLKPGAVTDFYGLENDSTITCKFSVLEKSGFGNLVLNITGLDSAKHYVFRILNQGKLITSRVFSGADQFQFDLPQLKPATYTLEVIFDENENGKWDPGNFLMRKHPEIIKQFTLDPIRPDWDMEQTVEIEKKTVDTDPEDSEEAIDEEEDDQN